LPEWFGLQIRVEILTVSAAQLASYVPKPQPFGWNGWDDVVAVYQAVGSRTQLSAICFDEVLPSAPGHPVGINSTYIRQTVLGEEFCGDHG
jgi:hypothetical protein